MKNTIYILRYALMIVAIFGSLYISNINSYVIFTFLSLLYIAIDRVQLMVPQRSQWVLHLVKIAYISWLCIQYGGMMYVLIFSAVFSLYPLRDIRSNFLLFITYLVSMNLSIITKSIEDIILANVMILIIGTALHLVRSVSKQKEEIQDLYDVLRRNHYELDEARHRVIEYAKIIEDVAQVEERNRISKDLHDELGHKLIRIKMMMEAILRVIPNQKEQGMEMLYHVRDQLSDSMESLRSTVRRLKPEDTTLRSYSLKQLIEDFGHDSGINVSLQISGIPFTLYPSEEVALYRNAQEAMTNAVRHGNATEVHIEINYEPSQVVMNVSNNGEVPELLGEKGLGLKGMEERIELFDGYIEVITNDRFTVRTVLPHRTSIS